MNSMKLLLVALAMVTLLLSSCGDDSETQNLTLNISGLENLGDDYAYEGWLIVDGSPVTAGIFRVNDNGELSQSSFDIESSVLESATAYVLTIEPSPDNDPAPSDVHILAGDFSSQSAELSVSHNAAIGTDFTSSTGEYILATPTDGSDDSNELSGVWWLNPTNGPSAGLSLPTLPAGWKYEGWAVIDGTAVSTGTFTSVSGADDDASFSGTEAAAPAYPGEDFLNNAPNGLSFPTDLSGGTVVISVEPSPDNSTAPFLLKPLVSAIPSNAEDRTVYTMDNNAEATNPFGSVSR